MTRLLAFTQVINTVLLAAILVAAVYLIFQVIPQQQKNAEYLNIMQACTEQRLYMAEEVREALKPVKEQAESQTEKEAVDSTLTNLTGYLHTPQFYNDCLQKTKKEWSLQ